DRRALDTGVSEPCREGRENQHEWQPRRKAEKEHREHLGIAIDQERAQPPGAGRLSCSGSVGGQAQWIESMQRTWSTRRTVQDEHRFFESEQYKGMGAIAVWCYRAAFRFGTLCGPRSVFDLMSSSSFIDLCLELGVLRFGEFTLKSGRVSPYFFNAGLFNTGRALAELGRHYAAAIQRAGIECDVLFGPAYKGIPLVAATAIALADSYGRSLPWAFNRKEAKNHGEGGSLVGAPLQGRVLIVDDVITAGTAIRESMEIIRR